MNLHDIINNICPLPHPAMEKLSECSFQTECPKGFHILKAGKVETNIYFIARGIGRAYITSEDKDITFWIGQEGDTLMSLKSYVKGEPGYENVELMEDSLLYGFRRDDLLRLYRKDIHIANWGRKLAEQEFLRTEKKLSQAQLAEMVGVSRNTISSIETGQFNPTAKLALILCIALDKKFEELFYF